MAVGRASGKRTLVELMDQDMAATKRRREEFDIDSSMHSRFFRTAALCNKSTKRRSRSCDDSRRAGSSLLGKENIPIPHEDDLDVSMEVALEVEEPPDPVTQEDGYLSPLPCSGWDTPELSSPVRPKKSRRIDEGRPDQDDFGVDPISSPPVMRKSHSRSRARRPRPDSPSPAPTWVESVESPNGKSKVSVRGTSGHTDASITSGTDLREFFGDGVTSDVESLEGEFPEGLAPPSTPSPPCPVTPQDRDLGETLMTENLQPQLDSDLGLASEPVGSDERERQAVAFRNETVVKGWRSKWAWQGKPEVSDTAPCFGLCDLSKTPTH
jgi:exonuclease 1